MISSREMSSLPHTEDLKKLSQALAVLDAIIEPEWEFRYYSYNAYWREGEEMASMRNGSGDEYFILFNAVGAVVRGFAHESPMNRYDEEPPVWPGVLDEVPQEFVAFAGDTTLSIALPTFCIWRRRDDAAWQRGDIMFPEADDPDGSAELLSILDGKPQTYQSWAQDYYEQKISLRAVEHVYQHRPLTVEVVRELNAQMSLEILAGDLQGIGYPTNTSS